MKKLLLFLLLSLVLSACGQEEMSENGAVNTEVMKGPPELIVRSNDHEVVSQLGTYSWVFDNGDGTSTYIEADSDIPPKIVENQTVELNTKLESEVILDFVKTPQLLTVSIWNDSHRERGVNVENGTFKTDERGYIVYEIYAKWHQGTAHYALRINVE